jgi:hypothetical protein
MKNKILTTLLLGVFFNVSFSQNNKINIGANLEGISDYSGTPVFVDLMKSSRRPLQGVQWSIAAKTDT